jgi:hypothetical protein
MAWKPAPRRSPRVRIVLDDGPSLLVANQGRPFPETAVIESLGQIGCEIVVAALDVEKEPEQILAQVEWLADSVAAGVVQLAA